MSQVLNLSLKQFLNFKLSGCLAALLSGILNDLQESSSMKEIGQDFSQQFCTAALGPPVSSSTSQISEHL